MTESDFHPSFLQPESPDVSLWRYMDSCKFDWLLANRRLYMSSADQLGDHLEGTTPLGEIARWDAMVAEAMTTEQRETLIYNRDFRARMAAAMRNQYFVSCWSMKDYESSLMWKAYTSGEDAVAVRTSFSALRAALAGFVNLGLVRYIDFDVAHFGENKIQNMFEWIMHKEVIFRDEAEVRAVAFPPVHDELGGRDFRESYFEREAQPGAYVYAPEVNLAELVRGVIVHPKATPAYLEQVRAQCVAHDLPPPSQSRGARAAAY